MLQKLLRPLIALLGLTLLTANGASAAAAVSAENRASGSVTVTDNLVGDHTRLSEEAVRENLPLRYDLASDSPVAAEGVASNAAAWDAAAAEAQAEGRAMTWIQDTSTPGAGVPNFLSSASPTQVSDTLLSNGFTASSSSDGAATLFSNGNVQYVLRPSGSAPAGFALDYFPSIGGPPSLAIKLGGPLGGP